MNLNQLLKECAGDILAAAYAAMARAHLPSYETTGAAPTQQRLKAFYELTQRCVSERNFTPMRIHAKAIAAERFESGFDLWEVQTAFNVLEEIIWLRILKELPPTESAEALSLVSTILGAGKDTLARTYVELASKRHAPSFNVEGLFRGTEGV